MNVLDRRKINPIDLLGSLGNIDILGSVRFGLTFALKYALSSMGIRVYSTIEYPVNGINVTVRPEMCWKRLESGLWELNCIRYISDVVKKTDTIFDVGAWKGPYTLLFSKLMRGKGRVYAFEPDKEAFDILRHHVEGNGLTNVHVERLCVANFIGKCKLRSFGSGVTSIMGRGTPLKEVVVETTTIDKYCKDNGICPDGIKIDVEGAEGLVIAGCQNVIQKYSPWVLLEFHGMLMSEKERHLYWSEIVKSAKKIVFIDGKSNRYRYGSEVNSMPDCPYFHVFIKY